MRYLGSKVSVLGNIDSVVKEYSSTGVFCDPFGGIGTVGSFMKTQGYDVITGDILYFAHCFQKTKIECNVLPKFLGISNECNRNGIEKYLSEMSKPDGWFIEEYSRKRKYFTLENAQHIQACMDQIYEWQRRTQINIQEYEILISSLIQSIDKVANTAGTYYAYLKEYSRKSLKKFKFELLKPIEGLGNYQAVMMDANSLVKMISTDILYLDPPYNERDYSRYYHLPETIATGISPVPIGKSGVFVCEEKVSAYNKKDRIEAAFYDLVNGTTAGCIILHYTDNGLIKPDRIRSIMQPLGRLDEFYFDSKGYSTQSGVRKCKHHIFRVMR